MKIMSRFLAALCASASSLAVQADTLRVTTTANFELPLLTAGPSTLSLGFSLTEPLAGVIAGGVSNFRLENIAIDRGFNSSSVTTRAIRSAGFLNLISATTASM